jgi:hypothetical protein
MEKIYTAKEYKQLQVNCIAAREQNIAKQKAFKAKVKSTKQKPWWVDLRKTILDFLCF